MTIEKGVSLGWLQHGWAALSPLFGWRVCPLTSLLLHRRGCRIDNPSHVLQRPSRRQRVEYLLERVVVVWCWARKSLQLGTGHNQRGNLIFVLL